MKKKKMRKAVFWVLLTTAFLSVVIGFMSGKTSEVEDASRRLAIETAMKEVQVVIYDLEDRVADLTIMIEEFEEVPEMAEDVRVQKDQLKELQNKLDERREEYQKLERELEGLP